MFAATMTLFNFLFCSVLLYSASHCLTIQPDENQVLSELGGIRAAASGFLNFCANARQAVMSRKIICIICKGFDPSCFHKTTVAPTTTPANTTTTTHGTTTTNGTTTTSTTTTTTPKAVVEKMDAADGEE